MSKRITRRRPRMKWRGRRVCDNSEIDWFKSNEENGMMEG
jgi:hypothetical protein